MCLVSRSIQQKPQFDCGLESIAYHKKEEKIENIYEN